MLCVRNEYGANSLKLQKNGVVSYGVQGQGDCGDFLRVTVPPLSKTLRKIEIVSRIVGQDGVLVGECPRAREME